MTRPANNPLPSPIGRALIGLLGVTAAAGLFVSVPADESGRVVEAEVQGNSIVLHHVRGDEHRTAYRDIVGVLTICDGDTANVRAGMEETREGCQRRLERQLLAHARPVMACTPRLAEPGRDHQRWAAVSLAYNIGVNAYCRSTVDRRFDAGDWRGGCEAILMWDRAGGRRVRGLTLRRQRERAICLRGMPT